MELKSVSRKVVIAAAAPFLLGGLIGIVSFLIWPGRDFGPALFGGVSIATGLGLLRHSETWRKFALVALGLQVGGTIGLAAFLLVPERGRLHVGWPGHSLALNTFFAAAFFLVLLIIETLSAWALTRRDVRAAFVRST